MNAHILTATLFAALTLGGSIAEAQLLRSTTGVRFTSPTVRTVAPLSTRSFSVRRTSTATRSVAPAPRPGSLDCRVEENGVYAPATLQLRDANGRVVASGDCARPMEVAAGTYDAVLTLETALDRPTRTVRVNVPAGGSVTARASFATAILEVRFTEDGRPVHGLAYIRSGGRVVGTVGSGVSARVSAGRYEIVARYRTEDRVYTVDLAAGQRRAVRAAF